MYIFTDPKVVECLHKIINVFGKIGEHINLVATPQSLQLSVLNSSLTVIGRAVFTVPLFSGSGAIKNVHIKARAANFVLKRLENEETTSLQLQFVIVRSGQEQLEIRLDYGSGIRKLFRIPCLQTAVLPLDFESTGPQPYTFECLPGTLKDAFASCEAGADEVKVSFQHNLVNLLARKRGKVSSESSVLRSGLRTIINLQPDTFRQITVRTPRQLEFKLKEFRVMLSFCDQLGEELPIMARFYEADTSTPLVFKTGMANLPGMEFQFKFLAKLTVPRVSNETHNSFLKVGPQPDWIYEESSSNAGSRRSSYSARQSDPTLRQARRERDRRMRMIAAGSTSPSLSPQVSPPVSALPPYPVATSTAQSNAESTTTSLHDSPPPPESNENNQTSEFDPDISEVGLTQGSVTAGHVPGLFD